MQLRAGSSLRLKNGSARDDASVGLDAMKRGYRIVISTAHFLGPFFFSGCGDSAGGADGGSGLRAHGQSALHDQVDGAIDRDADGAGVLVDIVVGAQRLFFLQADSVQLAALILFELGIGERALRIIFRDVARVLRSIGDQRIDRSLLGFRALVEKVVEAVDDEVDEESSHGEAQQEVENSGGADILALVAAVAGGVRGLDLVTHVFQYSEAVS